jgi:hypothetical protein
LHPALFHVDQIATPAFSGVGCTAQGTLPPGTAAEELTAALRQWGFVLAEPCDEHPTIKRAYYQEPEGWIVFMPLTANVYWKVDQSDRLKWTMGFVAFYGL